MDKIFFTTKHENKIWDGDKYKYFSQPKRDFLHQARKNLLKNYVLDPDIKLIG